VPVRCKAAGGGKFFLTTTAGGYGSLLAQGRRQYSRPNPAAKQKARANGRAFFWEAKRLLDQAAGLNNFDALALIGSTVSVATFWESSASSLV